MLYNVAQLLKQGVSASRKREVSGDLCDIDEWNPGAVQVSGQVVLIRTPRGVLAKGTAKLQLNRPCRRCLQVTSSEVTFDFEEEFLPSIDIETGATLPIGDADDPDLFIDEHHVLDLTEVLRQYALATGESNGLCREDCRGLCPVCGKDLNEGPCGCDRSHADPRMAVLAGLLGSLIDDDAQ